MIGLEKAKGDWLPARVRSSKNVNQLAKNLAHSFFHQLNTQHLKSDEYEWWETVSWTLTGICCLCALRPQVARMSVNLLRQVDIVEGLWAAEVGVQVGGLGLMAGIGGDCWSSEESEWRISGGHWILVFMHNTCIWLQMSSAHVAARTCRELETVLTYISFRLYSIYLDFWFLFIYFYSQLFLNLRVTTKGLSCFYTAMLYILHAVAQSSINLLCSSLLQLVKVCSDIALGFHSGSELLTTCVLVQTVCVILTMLARLLSSRRFQLRILRLGILGATYVLCHQSYIDLSLVTISNKICSLIEEIVRTAGLEPMEDFCAVSLKWSSTLVGLTTAAYILASTWVYLKAEVHSFWIELQDWNLWVDNCVNSSW